MEAEIDYINRLKNEMEAERALQAEKRRQEKEYLQKMLHENDLHKQKVKEIENKERLDDLKA